jgi:hypothetical protein
MAEFLVPNDGVRGVDITTEKGTVKYDADKSGVVRVDNPAHARQMKAEGFTRRGVSLGVGRSRFGTWLCSCEKLSFDYQLKCVHCGIEKPTIEAGVSDGSSDKSDSSAG